MISRNYLLFARPDPNYPRQTVDFFQENHQNLGSLTRPERKTKRKTDAYITEGGEYLYKLRQRNPLGYGRRRREAEGGERILVRVPRS